MTTQLAHYSRTVRCRVGDEGLHFCRPDLTVIVDELTGPLREDALRDLKATRHRWKAFLRFNRSTISTTVVAAVTSNLRLGAMPGNVRLRRGEAGLPRASVVNVSQIRTIDRARPGDRLGLLGRERMRDVLRGLALLLGTDEVAHDGA